MGAEPRQRVGQGSRRTIVPLIALLAALCVLGPGRGDATNSHAPVIKRSGSSVTLHLPAGKQVREFQIRRGRGVIRHYRVNVANGVEVLSTVRLHGNTVKTVPMQIRTSPGASRAAVCKRHGATTTCDRYGEPCPMPRGIWRFRVAKLSQPAARVAIRFRVSPERHGRAS
jgi:hypothetical protein